MAKAKENNSLRQRKPANGSSDEPRTEKAPEKSKPTAAQKSGSGMTCFNWFFVLFLIIGTTAAASFFLFGIIKLEVATIRTRMSDMTDVSGEIKVVAQKIERISALEKEIAALKKNEASKKLSEIDAKLEKYQTTLKQEVMNLEETVEDVKSSESSMRLDFESEIARLMNEIKRLNEARMQQAERISSVQQEAIDLTAEKTRLSSAIESIKSTVVHVRDKLEKVESERKEPESGNFAEPLQETLTRIDELERQISEVSENSAKWLQTSTREMQNRFTQSLEIVTKQIADLKEKNSDPEKATADESVLNAVASISERLQRTDERVVVLSNILASFEGKSPQQSDDRLAKVIEQVSAIQRKEIDQQEAISDVTKDMYLLRSDLKSVESIARILESRVGEIATGQRERAPEPAAAPETPENAIPDPDVAEQ